MPTPLAVSGLTKRYAGRSVVDAVSFEVPAGSVLCILGRNGAGKTTTVECAEGFRRPDAGTVRIFGSDPITQRAKVIERVGVMLQEGGAYQAATPREMLRLYAALYPRPRSVDGALDAVELRDRADSRFRTLSGGEKQRLNLALAYIGRPDLYFLDEPTAGMDPAARRRTWALVEQVRRDGAAVVLTTHFIDEAERLADRVAVLAGGRIVALDSPAALAGDAQGLDVTAAGDVDAAALRQALGVAVVRQGEGRYRVAAGPERIGDVTAWFAARGIALNGIAVARASLEETFLALTDETADDS